MKKFIFFIFLGVFILGWNLTFSTAEQKSTGKEQSQTSTQGKAESQAPSGQGTTQGTFSTQTQPSPGAGQGTINPQAQPGQAPPPANQNPQASPPQTSQGSVNPQAPPPPGTPQGNVSPQVPPGQQQAQGNVPPGMMNFMKNAAGANVFDVEAGKYMLQMSKNEHVKRFAERMINDHSEALQKLMSIAQMKGINLPHQMDPRHERLFQKLQQAKNLDSVYMKENVADHIYVLNELANEKPRASDPDLKAWIEMTIPVLRQHLAYAEEVQKQVEKKNK